MDKLDQNFRAGMSAAEVYIAGGNVWAIKQYRIIQQQVKEYELEEEACNILV